MSFSDGFESCDLAGWTVEGQAGIIIECVNTKPRTGSYSCHMKSSGNLEAGRFIKYVCPDPKNYGKIKAYHFVSQRDSGFASFPHMVLVPTNPAFSNLAWDCWDDNGGYLRLFNNDRLTLDKGVSQNAWKLIEFWYDTGKVYIRCDGVYIVDGLDAKGESAIKEFWLGVKSAVWGTGEGYVDDVVLTWGQYDFFFTDQFRLGHSIVEPQEAGGHWIFDYWLRHVRGRYDKTLASDHNLPRSILSRIKDFESRK